MYHNLHIGNTQRLHRSNLHSLMRRHPCHRRNDAQHGNYQKQHRKHQAHRLMLLYFCVKGRIAHILLPVANKQVIHSKRLFKGILHRCACIILIGFLRIYPQCIIIAARLHCCPRIAVARQNRIAKAGIIRHHLSLTGCIIYMLRAHNRSKHLQGQFKIVSLYRQLLSVAKVLCLCKILIQPHPSFSFVKGLSALYKRTGNCIFLYKI